MFLKTRFYIALTVIVLLLGMGYAFPPLFVVGKVALALLALAVVADIGLLYYKRAVTAVRSCASRFSNGDDNEVRLRVESSYPFPVRVNVVDEIPHIFQRRDVSFRVRLRGGEGKTSIGRPGPCTPWGKPALGLKTRKKNKQSNKLIVRRRNGKQ